MAHDTDMVTVDFALALARAPYMQLFSMRDDREGVDGAAARAELDAISGRLADMSEAEYRGGSGCMLSEMLTGAPEGDAKSGGCPVERRR